MNIDDKREAIRKVCKSYEDCLDDCPLWKHTADCYATATDEEIERNYERIKEAKKCRP